jgi:hypothetical protein
MKRLLFLCMCILFIGTPMVQADMIVYVNADRTVYDSTWDKVVLTITDLAGQDIVPGGQNIVTAFKGTWSSNGGIKLTGTSSTWYTKILNDSDAQDWPDAQTWVNFSTKTPDTPARTGTSPYYLTVFEGMGMTPSTTNAFGLAPVDGTPDGTPDDGEGYGFDNTTLGTFYIKHTDTQWVAGGTIYTGLAGYAKAGGGGSLSYTPTTTVQIVPEPTSLALLGCGLFGLLAYAWRKRK